MARYHRWLATLVEDRKNGTTMGAWGATAVLVLVVLILTSSVAPIASWFQLRLLPAVACFVPSFILGITGARLQDRGRMSLEVHGAFVLAGCLLLQFFFAALIALSRPPGSFALAGLFVLTLAFHGYLARASLKFPYLLGCSFLATLGAVFLDSGPDTLTVFAFVFPTGILVSLMAGQAGLREYNDRRERNKLRQAIHYKALNERAQAQSELSRRVMDLLGYNHDAGNTLSTVFLNAQLLEEQLGRVAANVPGTAQVVEQLANLLTQLERLKSLINRAHEVAEEMPSLERASLVDVVQEVSRDCQSMFPATTIEVVTPARHEDIGVRVHEGAIGLRRIVENILINACEGNGADAAGKIQIEIVGDVDKAMFRCIDDGPGFSAVQLAGPITPFVTTKPDGHGLGLFNISQLVRASGGELSVSNAAGRGAIVDVELLRHTLY
jgi:two-component system, NtrC family, C4-dicarboxylate transport sensor histidine kinase DctB